MKKSDSVAMPVLLSHFILYLELFALWSKSVGSSHVDRNLSDVLLSQQSQQTSTNPSSNISSNAIPERWSGWVYVMRDMDWKINHDSFRHFQVVEMTTNIDRCGSKRAFQIAGTDDLNVTKSIWDWPNGSVFRINSRGAIFEKYLSLAVPTEGQRKYSIFFERSFRSMPRFIFFPRFLPLTNESVDFEINDTGEPIPFGTVTLYDASGKIIGKDRYNVGDDTLNDEAAQYAHLRSFQITENVIPHLQFAKFRVLRKNAKFGAFVPLHSILLSESEMRIAMDSQDITVSPWTSSNIKIRFNKPAYHVSNNW